MRIESFKKDMKHVIAISEILGIIDFKGDDWEVCASADASFDPAAGRVNVALDAFLRWPKATGKETIDRPEWLPAANTITESSSLEEAVEVARDIFHSWIQKVRRAAPPIHSSLF